MCSSPSFAQKAGPGCLTCPAFKGTHYYPFSVGSDFADLVIVGDAPTVQKVYLVGGKEAPKEIRHESFRDDGGRVLQGAVTRLQNENPSFRPLQVRYLYAVKCAVGTANKATVTACSSYLKGELRSIAIRRKSTKLTVLACGLNSLHALGVPARSEAEALGRIYEDVKFLDLTLTVIFTRSMNAIGVAAGKYNVLLADVDRAMRVASNTDLRQLPRSEVEKNYIYPTCVGEVKDLVDFVIGYGPPNTDPLLYPVAVDTETNTKFPNWDGTKMIMFSVAWNKGKAASVTLWHKDCPYEPELAYAHVMRLMNSGKRQIWQNGKYDYKVFWKTNKDSLLATVGTPYWDTMLAEHVLEEDKKGEYGLKPMTKRYLPQYSGYEDQLHKLLEQHDAAQTTTVETTAGTARKLPPVVAEALKLAVDAKVIKGAAFQARTLIKLIESNKVDDAVKDALNTLLAAKKNGEFTAKGEKDAARERKRTGGFENVPLSELSFYAAVDVDVCRQIAVLQNLRMKDEDRAFEAKRRQAWMDLKVPNPANAGMKVEVLCEAQDPLQDLVRRDYMPRQHHLARIEFYGMRYDKAYAEWSAKALDTTITTTSQRVFDLCGEAFKVGSQKKLTNFLFDGGVGYMHPDPELAEEMARNNPDSVRFANGRIMYRAQHYTATGAMQTSEAVLKHLVARYKDPLANHLLSLRKAEKARNSFLKNMGILADMFGDGRIHAGYHLPGTSTGRLASSSGVEGVGFNNQNLPRGHLGALRDARGNMVMDPNTKKPLFEGVKIKKLLLPDDDSMCFGNADAKGAEVSIFAGYAKDAALIEALNEGMDAHCFFASQSLNPAAVAGSLTGEDRRQALLKAGIDDLHAWSYDDFKKRDAILKEGYGPNGIDEFKKPLAKEYWANPDLVSYAKALDDLRTNIKRLVFGMLFGAGIKKTAEIAGISLELAKKIQELLFTKFPTLKAFINQTIWEMRTFGVVETYHGRRRRFMLGKDAPSSLRARAERQAVNFKIQGTNSDVILTVLCWFAEALERDLGGKVLLTVHDSVGFQVPKKYAHDVPALLEELGTKRVKKFCPWLPVPFRWDLEMGSSYGDLQSAKEYLAGLPLPVPRAELDGYSEEEKDDDLREPTEHEGHKSKKNKKLIALATA